MNADVVHWRANDDMPLDKLSEAVQWVIEEHWKVAGLADLKPKVYFTYPSYGHIKQAQGGNQKGVYASSGWYAIVVSDEPLTEMQANVVMTEFYEEDDARGDYFRRLVGRADGRSPTPPTEQDLEVDRSDGVGGSQAKTEPYYVYDQEIGWKEVQVQDVPLP